MISLLKSKIHRATVSDSNLNYNGSITIYKELMKQAGIYEYEKVSIVNINNGNRFDTYVIKGDNPDSRICINGAAARLVEIGDLIIIMSYRLVDESKADWYKPRIVKVNEYNEIINEK